MAYNGSRAEILKHSRGWRRWWRHNEGHIMVGAGLLVIVLIVVMS
jgi:hypothetical protein